MSWRNLKLPHYGTVVTWDVRDIEEWLEKSDLSDFLDFVRETKLNGKSLLELDETAILFNKNLVDISVTKRTQLAKCVKECKNQASQAKKQISKCITECKVQANHCKKVVNKSLKTKKGNGFKVSNGNDHEESDFSGNEWGTDFDDSDDENESKTPVVETASRVKEPRLTQENRLQSTAKQNGTSKIGSYDVQTQNQKGDEIALPKESNSVVLKQIKRYPDEVDDASKQTVTKPQVSPKPNIAANPIPKPPNTNFQELKKLTTPVPIVSSTLTRPKIQPPAPPISTVPPVVLSDVPPVVLSDVPPVESSDVPPVPPFPFEEPEYLTPLHTQPPTNQNGILVRAYPAFAYPSSNSSTSDSQDNYEIISNPDDSGNGSIEFVINENQELGRRQAFTIANSLSTVSAGSVTIDSSLTPPLPQKTKLKSSSSISLLQNKIGGLKISISRNGYASNSLQNSKPLPPKPNGTLIEVPSYPDSGFSSFQSNQSNEKLKRPLPGLPPKLSSPTLNGDTLRQQSYFQDIERTEAARLVLSLGQDGAFLVRPTQKGGVDNPFTLTLVQSGKAFHLNIRNNRGKYALGKEKPNEKVFDTIPAMISYHRETPIYVTSYDCMGKECFLRISPTKY